MEDKLQSVEIKQKKDGSWQAYHLPSDRVGHGLSVQEAQEDLKKLLGLPEVDDGEEPKSSDLFEGLAKEIALFLEGEISRILSIHLGFARLDAYENGIVHVRLGGGCDGCPSQADTLTNLVKEKLIDKFPDGAIIDLVAI